MESPYQEPRATHYVSLEPNETVLTALPYRPHSTLLDVLKGEPKLLAVIQILLALIIMGLGIILAFSYFGSSKMYPFVFLTGYPFWGALTFIFAGVLTIINENSKQVLKQGAMTMDVISSLVAVAGIIFTLFSLTERQKFFQIPIGRILLIGILSVLLILNIAEFSISVTIASFRSMSWTNSDKVVFFLPSDVTQSSEISAPEENGQLQFKLQDGSSSEDMSPNVKALFFGGYAFFKLRVSTRPLPHQQRSESSDKGRGNYRKPSMVQKIKIKLKPLRSAIETRSSENVHDQQDLTTVHVNDEDLLYAVEQPLKKEAELPQDQTLPPQVFLTPSAQKLLGLQPKDLSFKVQPVQVLPTQALHSKPPPFHMSQFYGVSEDMPSQDNLSQEKASQDMPSNDLQPQNTQSQNQDSSEIMYQDIRTEVKELTQHWKSEEEVYGTTSPKRHSLDVQSKDQQSPRRKSLDKQIKAWLSPKRNSLNKQAQYDQTTERFPNQQAQDQQSREEWPTKQQSQNRRREDQQAIGKQTPKEQSKIGKTKRQQVDKGQPPKKQTYDQQAEGQQAQEEKYPKGQSSNWQARGQQAQVKRAPKKPWQDRELQSEGYESGQFSEQSSSHWKTPNWQSVDQQSVDQQSKDWRSQDWRDKDWKPQERQFKKQSSLGRESQDPLKKEALRQKALYQETKIHSTTAKQNLQWPLQNLLFEIGKCQGKDQEDFQSGVIREDTHMDDMQAKDSKLGDMESRCQKPTDLQSEDESPAHQPSSSQSLVQETYLTCLSNIDSERVVQKNTSSCSNAGKDLNVTSSSCSRRDQQQSEDSE